MTAIDDKYNALGGGASVLGAPTVPEALCPDSVGHFRHFQFGSIYWTPTTGAWEVHGAIRDLWESLGWELSALGYPTSDEQDTKYKKARVSHFQHGSIYWDGGRGAYEVFPRPAYPIGNQSVAGAWEIPAYGSGVVGMHAALLPNDKVLFYGYREPTDHINPGPIPPELGASATLDLTTKTNATPAYVGPTAQFPNIFCGGHAWLPDGRWLVAGGDREDQTRVRALHIYTPDAAGGTWRHVGQTAEGRWYPTCVTLPDGRVVIIAGDKRVAQGDSRNLTFEVFDGTTETIGAPIPQPVMNAAGGFITYPFAYVLPTGKFLVHSGDATTFYDLPSLAFDGTQLSAMARPDRTARTYPLEGTSVLLPLRPDATPPYRARVMAIGGGGTMAVRAGATASCEVLDLGQAPLAWKPAASLHHARVMPDAVLLPDGTVFVMNGSSRGYADNGANPVWESEIYHPDTDTWTDAAPMSIPRLYHATALLLPDGRVMTAGTDSLWNPDPFHTAETRVEVFSPPYLFAGPRPQLSAVPDAVAYGASFSVTVPDAATINSVALMRCGSSTHSFNSDQRHIGLTVVEAAGSELVLAAPPNAYVAPPGHYLLFVVRDGVPSEGHYVRVNTSGTATGWAAPRSTVGIVARNADQLDVVVADQAGVVQTAAWEPAFGAAWHGWWGVAGGHTQPGAPVSIVSRSANKLDAFTTGADGIVRTAAWEPAFADGWHGWWELTGVTVPPGAPVTAIARSADRLDLFVVGQDGQAWTTGWQPGIGGGWRPWTPIGDRTFPPGATIGAVSRSDGKLDIFGTDVTGTVVTAAWEPTNSDGWHGWWELPGVTTAPGAPVTCVSRSADVFDLFVVGQNGKVSTISWQAKLFVGWSPWVAIGDRTFPTGTAIHAVSRSAGKLDIFGTDVTGTVVTAAWEPTNTAGWHGWWELPGVTALPGSPVTAESRSADKLDVVVVANDGRPWTTGWQPGIGGGWRPWTPIAVTR